MQRTIVVLFLIVLPSMIFAQQFGGTPLSVKWKQINTDSVRVIFPTGLDSQAKRIASIALYQAAKKPVFPGDKIKKIDIVLQNQTTISNGYVGLGPYRSEFYLTPRLNSFELGSIPWGDQLALHEYRHVQQFNNFRHGISNLAYYLFGQDGYSLAINASIPDWFYEGDAVYNETILSSQGRGRLPLFMNAYPAIWQARKNYSWMKLRNGSFKDYVPDHYNLGYLLVNYGREKYGLDFWTKVTTDAASFKGLFYPFQHAIKQHTGKDYKTFIKNAFEFYNDPANAKAETGPVNTSVKNVFPVNKKVVTDYLFPYAATDSSLVYLKRSYNRRASFFVKDDKGEHWIRTQSVAADEQFSYKNGKIVYAAYETDPRWGWRDYSVIRVVDIGSGIEKRITRKSKYFTPDISASGEKIVAVQVAVTGKSELHVLNAGSGEIINKISSPEVNVFNDPKFISEDSLVFVVRTNSGQMALAVADINTGIINKITPPSFNIVGYPCVNNNVVYFTASYGGSDNVFAVKLSDKSISRLTDIPLGNYFVNVGNGKMTWSAFTAEGFQLLQVKEEDIKWEPVSTAAIEQLVTAYPVSHEKTVEKILPGDFPVRNFSISKYGKAKGLLNFHSWRPYYEDPEFSFTIYGENVLNTLQTQLYYLYNQNDRTSAVGFNTVYGGWFPYLSAGYQHTFNRAVTVQNKTKQWDQSDTRIGLNVPLNWIKGRSISQFNIGSNYYFRKDFNKGFYKDTFTNVQFSYLMHHLSFGQQAETARQHIYPRLGYNVSMQYRHAITNYKSWQVLAGASLYLPGLFQTNNLVFTAAYQETDTLNILFGNRFAYSRGYNAAFFSRMWRISANYHFPLFYPDWGFGNILYLQRIRGNIFYDLTRVYSLDKSATADQRSAGGEVYFDTKWWNQYPLSFGFRISYLMDTDFISRQSGVPVFEFILPVSIIPR